MSKVIRNKGGYGVGAPYELPGYDYDPVLDVFTDMETGKKFSKDSTGSANLEDNKAETIDVSQYAAPMEITPSAGKDGMKKVTVSLSNIPNASDLEDNKAETIDVSQYTDPVEVTPTQGKDGMKKVTVSLSNIPSGSSANLQLYAWNMSGEIAYTLSPNPKEGDFAIYSFNLASKATTDSFGIWGTDGSSYITFDESVYQRDSSLDVTISGPARIAIADYSILPLGHKLYLGKNTPINIDTDGEHSVNELFDDTSFTPIYAGTLGNVHFFTPYSG